MNLSAFARLAGVGLALCIAPVVARADVPVQATVLTTCGTMNYPVGQARTMTQDHTGTLCTAGGGGGGGAVTIADGADVTLGSTADAKNSATDTTPITAMQVLKEISALEQAPASRAVTNAGTFAVQDGNFPSTVDTNAGAAGANTIRVVLATGGAGSGLSSTITNPTSTLALPSTTTAYAAGTLMCTSATVATCNTALASQSFAIANSAGGAAIPRIRLSINDATSTGWPLQTIQIDLWSAAPTFATTGDRGVFNTDFLTGTANHLGTYTCVTSAVLADGVYAECPAAVGAYSLPKLASGTSVFWTAIALSGSGVTGASKTLTLTAELQN